MSTKQPSPTSQDFKLSQWYTNNFPFQYVNDTRSPHQKQQHSQYARAVSAHNMQLFRLPSMARTRIQVQQLPRRKITFPDGSFFIVTDNGTQSEYCLFCVAGIPGDETDWYLLANYLRGVVRVVSYVVPGFDGIDERRGQFKCTIEEMCQSMVDVLQHLGVAKAIYCAHSGGTAYAGYVITKYPHLFRGYVNLAGVVNYWSLGHRIMFKLAINDSGFSYDPRPNYVRNRKKLLDNQQFREQMYQRFLQRTKQVKYNDFLPIIPAPKLALCTMARYSNPDNPEYLLSLCRKIGILRLVAVSLDDIVIDIDMYEQYIHSINQGQFSYRVKSAELRNRIEARVKQQHGLQIDASRLQELFCFLFGESGHNLHKKRALELSHVIRVYITVIKEIDDFERTLTPKL